MVETRRTSRRLQAKAEARASLSPARSTRSRRQSRSPQQEQPQEIPVPDEEEEHEVVVIDDDTESETEVAKPVETKAVETEVAKPVEKEVEIVEIEDEQSDTEEEKADNNEEEKQEEEEEEIMLMDSASEEEEEQEENDDDEENVDQYAFLAASGLNLSAGKPPMAAAPPTKATAALKRRLVPNELDSGADKSTHFFNFESSGRTNQATLQAAARVVEEKKVVAQQEKATAHSQQQREESTRVKSAGRRWFHFASEEMTADARRDFALLKMRNYLDPKKFYKSSDHANGLPKHFQMGTVIEGASEFHSARLTKKQRRQTFTDEIMADEAVVQYTTRVASNIQQARSNHGRKKKRRH